jgi:outer membrane protein
VKRVVTRARWWRVRLFLLGGLAIGGSAIGSPAMAESLMDLYALAIDNDPTFQSAGFTLQAAKQQRPEAFSALLPALSATGSVGRLSGRTRYTDTPELNRSFDTDQWTLQLTQPVFRIEAILAYGEARATVEQAVAQYAVAEQDLILRLARAYFDAVVAQRVLTAARAQVSALTEQLLAARRSYDAGVASITDVDDTRTRAALAEAQQVAAANDVESSAAALEAITGTAAVKLEALKPHAVLPPPVPADPVTWIEHAQNANPSVKAAAAAARVADYELDRSRTQRLPTVDMVATYGGNYSSGNITDPVNFGTNVKDRQISLQVSVPLLDGGAIHARVGEARARRSKAGADLAAAQRQAAVSARQSFSAVLSGISQVGALEMAVAAGESSVKGNRIGYGLGIRINSDVLNAEQQKYTAMRDLDKARYDTLFEGLKLKAAAGDLAPADVREITALFERDASADEH